MHSLEKVFGKHSAHVLLMTRPHQVRRLLILQGKERDMGEILELARHANIRPEILPMAKFLQTANFTEEEKHLKNQGICLFAEPRKIYAEDDLDLLRDARVVLALDQVSNPQNLASIIRSAAFFGVDAVLLLKNRSADISPTVLRIAVGGAEYLKVFKVINLARSLDTLRELGFWVYGLDERGDHSLGETDFDRRAVLVIGAEGEGLRLRTRKFCDVLVSIPGGKPGLGSLNVGVATAVALAEISRKMRDGHPAGKGSATP